MVCELGDIKVWRATCVITARSDDVLEGVTDEEVQNETRTPFKPFGVSSNMYSPDSRANEICSWLSTATIVTLKWTEAMEG